MAFDKSKDKTLFEKTASCGMFNILVAVHSYDGGEMKLQISRQRPQEQGEPQFAKLGRMSLGEIEETLPLINEAIEFMKKGKKE